MREARSKGQPPPAAPSEPAFVALQVTPSRRASLVRRGDHGRVLAALTGATAIWGGTGCLVLPAEPDGTVSKECVRVAEVVDPP